jgi:hypothetical protein
MSESCPIWPACWCASFGNLLKDRLRDGLLCNSVEEFVCYFLFGSGKVVIMDPVCLIQHSCFYFFIDSVGWNFCLTLQIYGPQAVNRSPLPFSCLLDQVWSHPPCHSHFCLFVISFFLHQYCQGFKLISFFFSKSNTLASVLFF